MFLSRRKTFIEKTMESSLVVDLATGKVSVVAYRNTWRGRKRVEKHLGQIDSVIEGLELMKAAEPMEQIIFSVNAHIGRVVCASSRSKMALIPFDALTKRIAEKGGKWTRNLVVTGSIVRGWKWDDAPPQLDEPPF